MNRLRRNPKRYVKALRRYRGFFRGNLLHLPKSDVPLMTQEGPAAVNEAIAVARRTKPIRALTLSPALSRAAREHARELGRDGTMSHASRNGASPFDRMDRYGKVRGRSGENIGTGQSGADIAVIDLFVDDGVPSRGHRRNMLDPRFAVVGVGCAPHRAYGVICVMDFVEAFVPHK